MLEIFRRIDIEYRSPRYTGSRVLPIYKNPGLRIDEDVSPEKVINKVKEREERISKAVQEVFDDLVSRSLLFSRYNNIVEKK